MAPKNLRFDTDARRALEAGVNKLAEAVEIALGPKGQYVVLHKALLSPTITTDGVTIAQEIDLKDIFENQAAQMVKEVAHKTNAVAGDGTTTALVLAHPPFAGGSRTWPPARTRRSCAAASRRPSRSPSRR